MKNTGSEFNINLAAIKKARQNLKNVVINTPLQFCDRLSSKYNAKIFLKREDLQTVRSYKIRGAYNYISQISQADKKRGVVCASAGNHAQGVAFACKNLKLMGKIFMPKPTPKQKIERVKNFGGNWVELILEGDTFDEANNSAKKIAEKSGALYVHPFDDLKIIAGQGTVGLEILEALKQKPDYIVMPIGGGGLASGVCLAFKELSPKTQLIAAEPSGAASMQFALKHKKPLALEHIEKFIDGAAVKQIGQITYKICSKYLNKILVTEENHVCTNMIELYQNEGIVAEPAGALSVAVLDKIKKEIQGKTVVCIISGGNNDISRYSEILERSLLDRGLKHYFIIEFSQRPGALKNFLNNALGLGDDITLFEYVKKNNRESGPALVGIELSKKEDLSGLLERMFKAGLNFEILKPESQLYKFII